MHWCKQHHIFPRSPASAQTRRRSRQIQKDRESRAYHLQFVLLGYTRQLFGKLVPLPAFKQSAPCLRRAAAPLFEEEGYVHFQALITDTDRPPRIHCPRSGTAFPADDHPIDAFEVQFTYRPDERLNREKTSSRVCCLKVTDTGHGLLVFNRNAEPYMGGGATGRITLIDEFPQKRATLGEHLVDMPIRPLHGVEHPGDVAFWNFLVKEVAHGIYENHPRLLPFKRLRESFGPQCQIEAVFKGMTRHPAKAFGKPRRVAVIAARTHLGAARDRIPGRICPLDRAFVGHNAPARAPISLPYST